MPQRFLMWGVAALVAVVSSLHAQTTPDAGALRQQIESLLPRALPGEKQPLPALPQEYKPAPGLAVTVKQFRFAGNTLLTAEQLAPAVAAFLDRPLDFAGLQQAAAAVGEAYRAAGWLVRVYLPRQEITGGVVELTGFFCTRLRVVEFNLEGEGDLTDLLYQGHRYSTGLSSISLA